MSELLSAMTSLLLALLLFVPVTQFQVANEDDSATTDINFCATGSTT
jgi:hypothetical protein